MNEEIKKAKEQLDFLKNGTHSETFFENYEYDIECALNDIDNALNQAKENEEALKIIIEKDIKPCFIKINSLGTYNNHIKWNYENEADKYMLTQAEFNLLKKVVEKYGK